MDLNLEIFAVGKWNGMEFTLADLESMASAFNSLRAAQDVFLKLGHNDEQQMTDGQPALGWADKLWVEGDKLLAHAADVPDVVYKAVKNKLYKNVSVEMDVGVSYKGKDYPYVITAIALLGADIPAVNTLNDLTHYMSRRAALSSGRRAVFSAIAGQLTTGERNMEKVEELTNKVAELTTTIATFTADQAKLKLENDELKAKLAKFEADGKARDEAEAKAKLSAKRADIAKIFEESVKSEGITPAQRTNFEKALRLDDDDAVLAIELDTVRALAPTGKKQFARETGKTGESQVDERPVGVRVDAAVKELRAEKPHMSYSDAMNLVFTRDDKLAKEYYANVREEV